MFNKIRSELAGYTAVDWGILLFIIGVVLLIGFFSLNQFIEYRYKAVFLSTPCELCLELNEKIELCPKQIQVEFTSFDFPTTPL